MNRLIIIGASGHGKVVAEIAALNGYEDIVFLDDDNSIKDCGGYPVVGRTLEPPDGEIFVAIGNSSYRRKYLELYSSRKQPVLIHPTAVISKNAAIDVGTVVMAGAVINPSVEIGKGVIVNTCSSIDHDCVIDDYTHVSVGAHLCGSVKVGSETWVGAGSTVINNIEICSHCMIGAGALVVKDIKYPGTYVGIPARIVKTLQR